MLNKISQNIEAESEMMMARGSGEGEVGKCWPKDTKFHLCKISSGDLLYNTGAMMNNTVLCT